MSNRELEVLLIEDNPGDARLIEEMLRDTDELSQRIDPEQPSETPHVHHETGLADGLEYLESAASDVALLDLNLPDSDGLETLERLEGATEALPIIVLTGVRDQQTGVQAIQRGAEDYLVKDEVTSALLVRSIQHAIERKQQELEREQQRRQLAALNRLNQIGQDIAHSVITMSTREELEQKVCTRLASADAYRFAWIGAVPPGGNEVEPRAMAGVDEGYLEEISITVDDSETSRGPSGKAIRTKEVQVTQNMQTDPMFEPWREQAEKRGYRSSAAIPIVYEELLYGIINVYSETTRAFTEMEIDVLARLGEIVGHAITALERKDALVTDAVLELEFQVAGVAEPLSDLTARHGGTIRFDRLVRSDDVTLIYGSASNLPEDQFRAAVERTSFLEEMRVLSIGSNDEGNEYGHESTPTYEYKHELIATDRVPLFETIATHGGRVQSVTIVNGECRIAVELPQGNNTGQFIERLEEAADGVQYLAQRTVERDDTRVNGHVALETQLTEKQQIALETAVSAGYFDWPRTTTGEEVAERLDISPATFTQHLRAAERKFFNAMFET